MMQADGDQHTTLPCAVSLLTRKVMRRRRRVCQASKKSVMPEALNTTRLTKSLLSKVQYSIFNPCPWSTAHNCLALSEQAPIEIASYAWS